MKKTFLLLLLTTTLSSENIYSQTPTENLEKYWNYRDRFKKYFIKLGTNPGESILGQERCTNQNPHPFNLNCSCDASWDHAEIKWGDATVWTGYYLAVLASEYALLKQNGQNTTNTLNEIYYVLNAVNRLDKKAEVYMGDGEHINGFLLRDDVPGGFYQSVPHWTNDYDCMSSSAWDYSSSLPNNFNPNNEMSQDQVLALFIGLSMVNKLVDNVFIKPTPQDQGFYIVNETRAIVHRIMSYIVSQKIYNDKDLIYSDDALIISRWQIINPVTNKNVLSGGGNVFPFAGALSTAANQITGQYYNFPLKYCAIFSLDFPGNLKNYCLEYPVQLSGSWFTQLQNIDLAFATSLTFCIEYPLCFTFDIDLNSLIADFNVSMILEAATLSGLWSHNNLATSAASRHMYIFDLIYGILHNSPPQLSRQFYEGFLNSAPCTGPNKNDNNGWHRHNKFLHASKTQSNTTDNEWDGNDYMLLYNLYHLLFQNQTTLPQYQDISCQCYPGNAISGGIINSQLDIFGKFPQYQNFGLLLPEYLQSDATVTTSSGILNVYTDLVICDNKILTVTNNGQCNIGSDPPNTQKGNIIVRNGSKLIISANGHATVRSGNSIIIQDGGELSIQGGGVLEVKNNALVKIEQGGKITIDPGAEIQLIGTNALIDVQDINTNINIAAGQSVLITKTASASQGGSIWFTGGNFSLSGTLINENCYIKIGGQMTFNYSA